MATQTQISANRQNAQKSTGPKTPEGKAAIAQNALKHGLTAVRDVVVTENQEDFDLHRDALLDELAPQGPMELILADRIVSLSWRLRRAGYIQNQAIDVFSERISTRNEDPNLTLGRIALRDFYNEKVIDRLMMYERRIENSLYKTTLELKKLKQQNASKTRPTPIINNHSSIINIEDPPLVPSCLSGNNSFPQNKPNPKTEKTNTNPAKTNTYNKIQPPQNGEKQTQSNPIDNTRDDIRNTKPDIDRSRRSPKGEIPMHIGIRSTLKTLRHIP